MRLGTQIRMADGREGTCVYNGLDGTGVKWGLHDPEPADFEGTVGGLEAIGVRGTTPPADWPWEPEAMLRDPCPGIDLPCVGSDFTVTRYGLGEVSA